MNKYQESIKRIGYNFGLDCLYGKTDVALNEDISNMYELLNKCEKLEKALYKACDKLAFLSQETRVIYLGEINRTKEKWKAWAMKDE